MQTKADRLQTYPTKADRLQTCPTKAIYLVVFLALGATAQDAVAQQKPTQQPGEQSASQRSRQIVNGNFVVSLIDDTQVSAQEEGVLLALDAKEGLIVKKDAVLGRIDDSDAKIRRIIAENELKIATEQAESDADVQAAKATVGVALAEYDGSRDITERSSDAISVFEVRRLRLTHERSTYQSANAEIQHRINQLTRTMRESQLLAVDNEIERRTIQSPIDGVVVRKYRHIGDWVKAGEPIYRVVRMDRLRVEGLLSAHEHTPGQVEGRRVDLRIQIPDGKEQHSKETITIKSLKIDFASPVVDASNDFLIFAEFDNPVDAAGRWLIRPGLDAEVTIHLSPQSVPTAAKR